MSEYHILGGTPLAGEVTVHGAKNSVLPLLAATILGAGVSVLRGCPHLSDVTASIAILEHLGCKVTQWRDTITVDATTLTRWDIPDDLMRAMRSSVIFLGAVLARLGGAQFNYPGGCELGPRPIDLHLSALRALGAEIQEAGGRLVCVANSLKGADIALSLPSVGATENAMLAATAAQGTTTITNAAREPEIVNLQRFLLSMGARVQGAGTSVITVEGGKKLVGGQDAVTGDRIVAATYLAAAAAAGGEITLHGADYRHLSTVTALLAESGCKVSCQGLDIHLTRNPQTPLRCVAPIHTGPYPGFPTDAQAPVMGALCTAQGATLFVENMFDSRYRHVDELRRMGADIHTKGRVAVVNGVERLYGSTVTASDLRGGAALVVAALGAEGESVVTGLAHIDRGYATLVEDITALGGKIQRI